MSVIILDFMLGLFCGFYLAACCPHEEKVHYAEKNTMNSCLHEPTNLFQRKQNSNLNLRKSIIRSAFTSVPLKQPQLLHIRSDTQHPAEAIRTHVRFYK